MRWTECLSRLSLYMAREIKCKNIIKKTNNKTKHSIKKEIKNIKLNEISQQDGK